MKKGVKSIIAAALSASMLMSAACSFLDKSKDEVLEAADAYASAIVARKAKNVIKLSSELDEDVEEAIPMLFDLSIVNPDVKDVYEAIAASITYEVDEESVDASKKSEEGEVDIVFTMVDYESVLEDEDSMADLETCLAALEDADTMEITTTVEFVLEDDEWLVDNTDDVLEDLYAFIDAEVSFPEPALDLTAYLDADEPGYWYFTSNYDQDNPVYENTTEIDLDLEWDQYPEDYSGLYYTVEVDGNLVYTSSTGSYYGYYEDYYDGAQLTDEGYLIAGTYTITFYDANNEDMLVYSDSCTVEVNISETATETTGAADDFVPGEVDYLTQAGDAFYDGTSVAAWYDVPSDTVLEDGIYPAGTSSIQFTFMDLGYTDAISAEFYYSADGVSDNADLVTTVSQTADDLVTWADGDYYEINLDGVSAGYYYIIVYDAAGTSQVIGCCQVQ